VTIVVPHSDGIVCLHGACCEAARRQVRGVYGIITPFESPWVSAKPEPQRLLGYPVVMVDSVTAVASLTKPKGMTKAEYLWGQQLQAQLSGGEIVWSRFHGLTLLLGHDCRYTPDYAVVDADGGLRFDEVKGAYIRNGDDGMVKLRTAATLFPFRFYLRQLKQGQWTSTHIPKAA
jgi:hypothetical protein